MKTLTALLCLVTSAVCCAASIKTEHYQIDTQKVAHVIGFIDDMSATVFLAEMQATESLEGDRLIFIDSPGGSVSSGNYMIAAIDREKASGVKVTCVVGKLAASMAFNLLTHCDVRIADTRSVLLFHKVEIGGRPPGVRMTAENLRKIAELLDEMDEPFRVANASALGMSLEEYDFYANHETYWNSKVLFRLGYLNDISRIYE